jgi:hypothetical protein
MEVFGLNLIALVFAVFAAIIALFNRWSRRYSKPRKSDAKYRIYACGEDVNPGRMNVPQDSFYTVMIRSLKLDRLRAWHSGHLTRYLVWAFTGMVIIMAYLLLMWGL